MSKVCEITGTKPVYGKSVSHANNKTNRRFEPNLQKKRFYIAEEGRWVTLRLTARAIKTIAKNGIGQALKDAGLQK